MKEERSMARATQIRIATGTTAYAGNPEDEGGIRAREVRVEVTYRLLPGEDPAQAAFAKAEEVERTHLAVWEGIRAGTASGAAPEDRPLDLGDPGPEPPDNSEPPRYPDPFPEEAHYACSGNGYARQNGVPAGPPVRPEASAPFEAIEWSTRPQQMAIRSHFTRLSLGAAEQAALLKERFDKAPYQRLTKAEAAQLMRALESGEWAAPAVPTVH